MKKLWSHVTKCQKLFVVTLVLAGILWMTGFNPVDSGVSPREVEAATIVHSGKDGALNWSIDDTGLLLVEGEGDYDYRDDWLDYRASIKAAVIKVKNIKSLYRIFNKCNNLESIDLSGLDTSQVTNMGYMFNGCSNLESVDLSGFDTSQVTNMSSMFYGCSNLESVDLSKFDTSQVTDMEYMFNGCSALESVDLSKFDTSQVTSMKCMFNDCKELTNIDLSKFDTSQVMNMAWMFSGCEELTKIDLSGFDTSKVVRMSGIFSECKKITKIDLNGIDTSKVIDMGEMFSECNNLAKIDLSGIDTSQVISMGRMFAGCEKITNIDLSGFNTSQVTNMSGIFSGCSNLEKVDLSKFDTSQVTSMGRMFAGCEKITNIDLSGFNTSQVTNMKEMFLDCEKITSIDLSSFDTSQVTSMAWMFNRCEKLTNINLSGFDTSQVTNMEWMFSCCKEVTNIDLSNFDTSQVIDMRGMFNVCKKLTKIDLNEFDTSKVTDMGNMFSNCEELTNIDLSNFDTSQVIDMGRMFYDCKELTKIDLSNFDTSQVRSMYYMFAECKKLASLDLSNFDTSQVRNMYSMFSGCTSLTELDLSGFDTSQVTDMSWMFSECEELTKIDLSRFDTSQVTDMDYMFVECKKLASLDLSKFNTSKIECMNSMFYDCASLRELDLSNFDISIVRKVDNIFKGCMNLEKINTPINKNTVRVELPKDDGQWKDELGTIYEALPENMDKSIVLTRDFPKKELESAHVSLKEYSYEYIGNEIRPEVKATYKGMTLVENINYTVSYENNINCGRGQAIVTGKGCYVGTIVVEFNIVPKELKVEQTEITLEQTDYEYTGNEIQPTVTVKDISGKILTKGIDYTVSCENNINLGKAKVIITGKGNYTGTLSTEFTIIQKNLNSEGMSIALEKTAYEYTGTPIQPTVIVKDASEKVLTQYTDYTVSYENNTNVGTATVTVAGKGNYTGAVPVEFTINPKVLTLKDEDVTIDSNGFVCDGNVYEYTGEEIKPVLTINGLAEGTDYELSYKNNVEEGIATVTAACKGNYSGEYIYEYTIVKEPIFIWNKEKCTSDAGEPEVAVKERTNPTCAKVGRILYVATLEHMGKVYTSENEVQLPATGKHSWDKGVVKGSKLIYTCKVCKQTQSVERKVKSIAIAGLSHNIAAGKKVALTATVLPANAINKKVVWTTSNKKVATVSQRGIVSVLKNTGKKSVIITATAADGSRVKQSFKITSMKGVVTKVSLSGKNTLAVGKSQKVKATVKASAGAYKSLKWTSSNVKYATVSSNGTVKALKAGKGKKVTITAMALDGSGKKATFSIKIK